MTHSGGNSRGGVVMRWEFDDGGRAAAGLKGDTNDCVTRAVAIATGLPYRQVYDDLHERSRVFYATSRTRHARRVRNSGAVGRNASPRSGIVKSVTRAYLADLGWTWHPTMQIGAGTTVHLRDGELPGGRLVAQLSRHVVAVVDGVVRDNHDCTRDGTRAVYGYWAAS